MKKKEIFKIDKKTQNKRIKNFRVKVTQFVETGSTDSTYSDLMVDAFVGVLFGANRSKL